MVFVSARNTDLVCWLFVCLINGFKLNSTTTLIHACETNTYKLQLKTENGVRVIPLSVIFKNCPYA